MSSETTWTLEQVREALRRAAGSGWLESYWPEVRAFLEAARRSQPAPEAVLPDNRFDCATCGQGIAVDEDGCCATCGAQAVAVRDGRYDVEDLSPAPEAVPVLDQATVDRLAAEGRELSREMHERVKKMRTPEAVRPGGAPRRCVCQAADGPCDRPADGASGIYCFACQAAACTDTHAWNRAKAKAGAVPQRVCDCSPGCCRDTLFPDCKLRKASEQPAAPGGFSTPRPWPWPAVEVHPEDARLARERLLPSPRAPEESEQPAAPPGFRVVPMCIKCMGARGLYCLSGHEKKATCSKCGKETACQAEPIADHPAPVAEQVIGQGLSSAGLPVPADWPKGGLAAPAAPQQESPASEPTRTTTSPAGYEADGEPSGEGCAITQDSTAGDVAGGPTAPCSCGGSSGLPGHNRCAESSARQPPAVPQPDFVCPYCFRNPCMGSCGAHTFPALCRGCRKPLVPENFRIADGCPCNSGRGINHGLVPILTCTCVECDPAQTGSTRAAPAVPQPGVQDHFSCKFEREADDLRAQLDTRDARIAELEAAGKPLSDDLAFDGHDEFASRASDLEARIADMRETIVAQNIAYDRLEASSADLVRRAQEAETSLQFTREALKAYYLELKKQSDAWDDERDGLVAEAAELRGKLAAAEAKRGKCENAPCPKCGGGPEGEWFEGSEVKCADCGVWLTVATIEECRGRSTFDLVKADEDEGAPAPEVG